MKPLLLLLSVFPLILPLAEAQTTPNLSGTTWNTLSLHKFKVQRLGKDTDVEGVRVQFTSNVQFRLTAVMSGTVFTGTYTQRGKRIDMTLDGAGLAEMNTVIRDWTQILMNIAGIPGIPAIQILDLKMRGNVKISARQGDSIKYKMQVKFTASAAGQTVKGKYQVKGAGARV